MVATVQIHENNGPTATPTNTDKTAGTVRFKNADNATVDTADRLIVPTANREYSYEKWLQLRVTVAPDVDIDNLRAYSDGAKGWQAGVKGWFALDGTYSVPVVPAETLDPPQHDVVAMTDYFTLTSGAPANMDAINAGPFAGTGAIGDFLVLVMEVEIASTQGAQAGEPNTWAFDET